MKQELKDKIDNAQEFEHFFFIDECGMFLHKMRQSAASSKIEINEEFNQSMAEIYEIQKYVASKLTKWGVDPESVTDRENGTYWKWFTHWNNWHKKTLTDEEWEKVNKMVSEEKDISKFLPKKKWNDG